MKLWEEEQQAIQKDQVLAKEEKTLKSKVLYKLFLIVIKYSPFVMIITEVLFSILMYFDIEPIVLPLIGGATLINIVYLFIASYVFRFCYLYRLSLYTIIVVNILALYDTLFRIPLSDLNMLRMYLIILLVGIVSFIGFKYKEHKKSRPSN